MPKNQICIQPIQKIWTDALGINIEAIASFDHMGAGLASRIPVGYEIFRLWWKRNPIRQGYSGQKSKTNDPIIDPLISIVLDTVVPSAEIDSGDSLDLGFLSPRELRSVADSEAFFFRNSFSFDFNVIRQSMFIALDAKLAMHPRPRRLVLSRKVMGGLSIIEKFWAGSASCEDVIRSRRELMRYVGIPPFKGKIIRLSELLPIIPRVIEEFQSQGFDVNKCPGVAKFGVARVVKENGRPGDILDSYGSEVARMFEFKQAIPTMPITILSTSFPFPHFGNDYGHLDAVAEWLGVPHQRIVPDNQNSWPTGEVIVNEDGRHKRRIHSFCADLLHYDEEEYRELLGKAVTTGQMSFSHRLGFI